MITSSVQPYLTIRDLDLKNKRVFIRVDFNVPLQKNDAGQMAISSDKRIRASLPTIQYALDHEAAVILGSHLDRPKGKPNPEMSLKPVAKRLEELLGKPVAMAPDCVGDAVKSHDSGPGRCAAARKSALPRRRGEERSGVRAPACGALRRVRERCVSAQRIARTPQPRASCDS